MNLLMHHAFCEMTKISLAGFMTQVTRSNNLNSPEQHSMSMMTSKERRDSQARRHRIESSTRIEMMRTKKMMTMCHYLDHNALHHDLLSVWLDACQGKQLGLEQHWRLGRVAIDVLELFLAPFHLHCSRRYTHTQLAEK